MMNAGVFVSSASRPPTSPPSDELRADGQPDDHRRGLGDWSREVGRTDGNAPLLLDIFDRVSRGDLHAGLHSTAPLADVRLSVGRILQLIPGMSAGVAGRTMISSSMVGDATDRPRQFVPLRSAAARPAARRR